MLNANSTSAIQKVKISDALLWAHTEKVKELTIGKVFTKSDFASDWNSIYVNPYMLREDEVKKGMRKIQRPTLVITSHGESMAFILASKKEPVYIPSNFIKGDEGYLMAFELAPLITPEYVYYMCRYDQWSRLMSWFMEDDGVSLTFKQVGFVPGYHNNDTWFSPETVVLNGGSMRLPTLEEQRLLVEAAMRQEANFSEHSNPGYDIKEIVSRYLKACHSSKIISNPSIGLLVEAYRESAGDKINPDVIRILNQYDFCKGILCRKEIAFLGSNLNELFHLAISANGTKFNPSDGFVQPQEVTDFMCKLASFPENVTVYNPFAGANSYAIALPNHVAGEELYQISWAIGQIRLFANHLENRTDIRLGDSFESIKSDEKFSAIISSPPYLGDKGREIADIVQMLYDKLEDGGKLACIVYAGFLFRKDNRVRSVRENLIKDKAISSVVMLPPNIFTDSSVAKAAIILTKGVENEEILFGDACGHTRFAKSVYRATTFDLESFLEAFESDIKDTRTGLGTCENRTGIAIRYENLIESDLTPALYLTPKPSNGVPLSELVEVVSPERNTDEGVEYFLTGSLIPAAMHRKPFVPVKVENGKEPVAKNQVQVRVPNTAVILAIAGGDIRTVYTEGFTGKVAFPVDFIKILKPANGISAKYLAALLATKIVADQIKVYSSCVTIPRLGMLDLRQIIVPLHSTVEEQEQLISEVLSSEMGDLENELQEILDSQKREVRSTRHAMIQTLSALSSNWEQLEMFAVGKKDEISLSDNVGHINPISVKDLMESIKHAISTLQRQVESLRFEKRDWGKDSEINPFNFINDYIATHSSPSVRMVNIGNENESDLFYAPVRLIEHIFDNIVANAKAHGFSEEATNNEIRFDWRSEDGGIIMMIANNGSPLKEGVTGEDVLMRGFTTALNENASDGKLHSGQGGFEIKSLMEGLGNVEVISQPDAEFPVIYKLTFKNTNFETIDHFED